MSLYISFSYSGLWFAYLMPDEDVGLLVFRSLLTFNQRVVYLVVWSLPKAVGSVVFEVTLWSAGVLCLALCPGKYECLVLALLVTCKFLYLPLLCTFFQVLAVYGAKLSFLSNDFSSLLTWQMLLSHAVLPVMCDSLKLFSVPSVYLISFQTQH